MKARFFVSAGLAMACTAPLVAQCPTASTATKQACNAAVDMINFMTPQLSTAIAGGSSTLGQSGALGGLGRFALSIRGTGIINGGYPDIGSKPFDTNGNPVSYAVKDQIIPGAGVDAAIGVWKGVNLGVTHVGAVDLLVSALYMPDITSNDPTNGGGGGGLSIKATDGNLKLGYGVRVGVLEEGVLTPGVYVSYLQRDLPTFTLSGNSGSSSGSGVAGEGTFALNNFAVKTTAIRLVAAKTFLIFGLQAGVGQDTYKSTADVAATVNTGLGSQTANGSASMSMTRTNVFVGAMINFFVFKLVAEAGQVSGGSLATPFNTFDKQASASRTYLSGGLRLAF